MDRRTFDHLCELARLQLSDEEIVEFERKFKSLLRFVEKTQAYEPQADGAPLVMSQRVELRRDTPETFTWPEGQVHDYRVPKIIDFEGGS